MFITVTDEIVISNTFYSDGLIYNAVNYNYNTGVRRSKSNK